MNLFLLVKVVKFSLRIKILLPDYDRVHVGLSNLRSSTESWVLGKGIGPSSYRCTLRMGPGKGESHWDGDRIPPTWPCRPHVTNCTRVGETTTLAVASDSAFSGDAESDLSERVASNADSQIHRF